MKPAYPILKKAATEEIEDAYLEAHEIAKNQPEYTPLWALVSPQSVFTSRWQCSWMDRLRILFTGSLYVQTLTFGRSIQPIKLLTKEPTPKECQ